MVVAVVTTSVVAAVAAAAVAVVAAAVSSRSSNRNRQPTAAVGIVSENGLLDFTPTLGQNLTPKRIKDTIIWGVWNRGYVKKGSKKNSPPSAAKKGPKFSPPSAAKKGLQKFSPPAAEKKESKKCVPPLRRRFFFFAAFCGDFLRPGPILGGSPYFRENSSQNWPFLGHFWHRKKKKHFGAKNFFAAFGGEKRGKNILRRLGRRKK